MLAGSGTAAVATVWLSGYALTVACGRDMPHRLCTPVETPPPSLPGFALTFPSPPSSDLDKQLRLFEERMRGLGYSETRIADILSLARLRFLGDKLKKRSKKAYKVGGRGGVGCRVRAVCTVVGACRSPACCLWFHTGNGSSHPR